MSAKQTEDKDKKEAFEEGSSVIEVRIELEGASEELASWLMARGITDFVEASCDFLDASDEEAREAVKAYEAGTLLLPLLLYSYDALWLDSLHAELRESFGTRLRYSQRQLADQIWREAWQPNFRLLETARFRIAPEDFQGGDEAEGQAQAKTLIRLASGQVFGSGAHATTAALVRLLERLAPSDPATARLLDVGTGTGVLCFVAYHLGFRTIWATDIEAEALATARANQRLNHISFPLFEGSLPPREDPFAVILCNILPPTLTRLLPALVAALEAGGLLFLAGLNPANEAETLMKLEELGLEEVGEERERGWVARAWRKY